MINENIQVLGSGVALKSGPLKALQRLALLLRYFVDAAETSKLRPQQTLQGQNTEPRPCNHVCEAQISMGQRR